MSVVALAITLTGFGQLLSAELDNRPNLIFNCFHQRPYLVGLYWEKMSCRMGRTKLDEK